MNRKITLFGNRTLAICFTYNYGFFIQALLYEPKLIIRVYSFRILLVQWFMLPLHRQNENAGNSNPITS